MRQAVEKTIGSLKVLTLEGRSGGAAVMMLHGWGADFSDLIPLAEMLGLSSDVTWVFPNAPQEVIIAPGFYGRAWFPIDTKGLEDSVRRGEPADMSNITPPGLEGARKLVASTYDELLKCYSHVVIGGFSQGAMVATELAFTHAKKPAGLVLLSTALLCRERWQKLAPSCAGLTFFQSHGKNDPLLGYAGAEKLNQLLNEADLYGDLMTFSGGHEIPPKVIENLAMFLHTRVKM